MDTDDPEAGLSEVHGEPKASDRVRIVVVGDSGVGKSSLVHLLCHGAVLRHAGGTVGCEIDVALHAHYGTPFFVELLEVGGADKFRLARGVFFTQPFDGVMLVHDLTNRNSLHNLERWRREIADARPAAEVAVADSSVPAGSASSSGASSGARRTHPALDGSPGPSLSRRQLSTGVPPAEEEWLDAGEMVRLPWPPAALSGGTAQLWAALPPAACRHGARFVFTRVLSPVRALAGIGTMCHDRQQT